MPTAACAANSKQPQQHKLSPMSNNLIQTKTGQSDAPAKHPETCHRSPKWAAVVNDTLVLLPKQHVTARLIKQQNDEKKFTELLDKGHVLRSMHEYARALDSYQHAAAIFPNDLRCKPMIDSLDAMVKAKADHERFIDAKDYQGSTAEAQRLLKMPGMQDDAGPFALHRRSSVLRDAAKLMARPESLG